MRDLYKSTEGKAPSIIRSLGVSPNSKFLATGSKDGEVKVSFSKEYYPLDLIVPDMDSLAKAC